jgi:hypothetical protein
MKKTKKHLQVKKANTEMIPLPGRAVKIQSPAASLLGEKSYFKPVKPESAVWMPLPPASFARPPTPAIQIPSPKSVHSPVDRSHAVASSVKKIKRIINTAFLVQSQPKSFASPYDILAVAQLLSEPVLSHPNLKNYRSEETRLATEDGKISPWAGYTEDQKPLLEKAEKEKTAFIEQVLKAAEEDYQADLKGRSSSRFR